MHIVLLADPELPVPPKLYGGIERIIDLLIRQLLARGHEVTLFAHPDSSVPCELVPWIGKESASKVDTVRNAAQFARYLAATRKSDLLIHSFARVAYLLPILAMPLPKLQSYQRAVTTRSVRLGDSLSRGTLLFTACSESCAAGGRADGRWAVVYNAVDTDLYTFQPSVPDDAPLVFLGRVERIKGAHSAIEIARRVGRRLVIAGNLPDSGPDVEYAQEIVRACDGEQIRYVGPVNDAQKNALLGDAAGFLMPIEWEEPFGIVMAEAMACGTPVIGLRRGSVPEVVTHGVDGFVCDDLDQMTAAVGSLGTLDRRNVRRTVEQRFSARVMTDGYEKLYREEMARL